MVFRLNVGIWYWSSGGIGKKYDFAIKKILLVPHGGWHNDTICTVEIKT